MLRRWRRPRRPLRALQVEVTSRCTRCCRICPRAELAERWRDGDLSPELWRRLVPDLGLARHVHLQGWGEPLLHPLLPQMVRDAHRAGCEVGLTTNGDLLAEAAGWIVAEQVELVTVSVAGADQSHHELRDGRPAADTWGAVAALDASRRRLQHCPTRLQVSYLLTRSNAAELAAAVHAADAAGADEIFVVHLDVAPTPALRELRAFSGSGLRPGIEDHLDAAQATADSLGICFRGPTRRAEEPLVCALDPRRFVAVGWDGRVGPCVNHLMPVAGTISRTTPNGEVDITPVVYGDLARDRLRDILAGPLAREFRAPFEARMAAESRFLTACDGRGRTALEQLDRADRERQEALTDAPFPASCAACPKTSCW